MLEEVDLAKVQRTAGLAPPFTPTSDCGSKQSVLDPPDKFIAIGIDFGTTYASNRT
jgi:hypothetical protein